MPREIKKGDSFLPVHSVDLAVSLWTMDIPFYDPDNPYSYRQVGANRSILFFFELKSPAGLSALEQVKLWANADRASSLPEPISVCKRTIWERRWILKEIHKPQLCELKHDSNVEEVSEVKLAAIAYALGFAKPNPAVVHSPGKNDVVLLVGREAPKWLQALGFSSLDDIKKVLTDEISFVKAPGNDLHPVALAIATYINIVAFLDHFRNEAKPYMQFTLTNGRQLWVKEGSSRYNELLEAGYFPS
jgi:hypothetical protein